MEFKEITSRDNSLIKLVCALNGSSSKRREQGLFVLEGLRLCSDAYENSIRFDKLIVSITALEKYSENISSFANNADECFLLPDSLFSKIADTKSPQGIIALSKIPEINFGEIKKNGRYIALENISDPSNLGAVSRTAEALSVDGIILSDGGCDPYSPKVLRASMGTVLRMPIFVLKDFSGELFSLGLKTYSCVVDSDAQSLKETKFEDGSIIIIGNEANGITEEVKALSNEKITIPMSGRAESLNAAAAAAIVMWEMMK